MDDERAWEELFMHYRHFMYHIFSEYRIMGSDADDLVQEVMIILTNKLESYDVEKGQFRKWLSRVIRNQALMQIRKRKTQKEEMVRPSSDLVELVQISEASDLEQKVDQEWKAYITTQAMARVKERFSANTMYCFQASLKGESAEKIAQVTGIAVHSVYIFKGRVKKALMEEIRSLSDDLEH